MQLLRSFVDFAMIFQQNDLYLWKSRARLVKLFGAHAFTAQ